MPPACPTCTAVRPRPAGVVNAAIRALATRATWTADELAEYARLLAEEQAAKAAEAEGAA